MKSSIKISNGADGSKPLKYPILHENSRYLEFRTIRDCEAGCRAVREHAALEAVAVKLGRVEKMLRHLNHFDLEQNIQAIRKEAREAIANLEAVRKEGK